jgi:copper chaperone CopZ
MSRFVKRTFQIEGMHCTSCAMNIDFDLEDIEGIKSAKTNYAKQVSEVEFDEDKITVDEILSSVKKTGYTAQLLKEV